jgi:hypothetical protein
MKTKTAIVCTLGLIILGTVQASADAPDKKAALESAKKKAAGLHASLIPQASRAVRSKISASAAATRKFLAKCGKNCDLYTFMTGDLKSRFRPLTNQERDHLVTLVFAETLNTGATDSEKSMLELQDLMNKQQFLIEVMSKIMNTNNDTLQSILHNL